MRKIRIVEPASPQDSAKKNRYWNCWQRSNSMRDTDYNLNFAMGSE